MGQFKYRAVTATGVVRSGTLEGISKPDALNKVRQLGLSPIDAVEASTNGGRAKTIKSSGATRKTVNKAIGELSVLLGAGLTLDRALTICIENIDNNAVLAGFVELHKQVKEGIPLSRAMAFAEGLFPPMAWAMVEAGEANGKLSAALAKLSETLERAEDLRQTLSTSMIYPIILLIIATSVILVMLLLVVPQFESLITANQAKLPPMTEAVMGASHALKNYGLYALVVIILAGLAFSQWMKQPSVRQAWHRNMLGLPQIGVLIKNSETARFARVLGSLVDGGVPLPTAITIAQRSLSNTYMAAAIGRVAAGLKQGGGLTGPLAATGVFPKMALGFLRTGEETSQLGLMLERLADVLDRDVRLKIQRLIGVLTPAITVILGGVVATIIASIMSAILGFNDLALAP